MSVWCRFCWLRSFHLSLLFSSSFSFLFFFPFMSLFTVSILFSSLSIPAPFLFFSSFFFHSLQACRVSLPLCRSSSWWRRKGSEDEQACVTPPFLTPFHFLNGLPIMIITALRLGDGILTGWVGWHGRESVGSRLLMMIDRLIDLVRLCVV